MASIILSSTSFLNGSIIAPEFKNNSVCGEANRSPQFAWEYFGMVPGHIEYFNLYVEDSDTLSGSSPNNKFLHWGVQNIDRNQLTIPENGAWLGTSFTVLPTDHGTGDRTNGWNGPCTPSTTHIYRAWIEAKIYPEFYSYIFGSAGPPPGGLLKSPYIYFLDNIGNQTPALETGSCGELICPPGYTLVNGICQEIIVAPAILADRTFKQGDGRSSINDGIAGTRFYANADQYLWPLRGTTGATVLPMGASDAIMQDNNGTGVLLTYALDAVSALWTNQPDGRLFNVGIWATDPNSTGQWIGISKCVQVAATQKYCIGIAADNAARISINGNLFVRLDRGAYLAHYRYWHVFEVTLNAGVNIIEFQAYVASFPGVLGFEIYDVPVGTLMTYTTALQLAASGCVVHASSDTIGASFDIGSSSGYSCPVGFAYNACDGIGCVDINYQNPITVNCCWLIQNCDDEQDTYLVEFDPAETTPIYGNDVYAFAGSEAFTGKCFIAVEEVVCPAPQVENVTVTYHYGTNACGSCHNTLIFRRCNSADPPEIYIELSIGHPPLIQGNIYRLSIFTDECFIYMGPTTEYLPSHFNVDITADFQSDECAVCNGCLRFASCEDPLTTILIRLAPGQDYPDQDDIDDIFILSGHPTVLGPCWQFKGYEDCLADPAPNVVIEEHYECKFCIVCTPYYLLTNCADPSDTRFIYWAADAPVLDNTHAYVFDFAPTTCYRPTLEFTPCENIIPPVIYDETNIDQDFENCTECLRPCYKLIDCGDYQTVGTVEDFTPYNGRIIQWEDDQNVRRCALVLPYICWNETYPMPAITVLACYPNCETCDPVVIEPEFSIPHRHVAPGYTVPGCSTGSSCNPCESTDCCNDCTPCPNTD